MTGYALVSGAKRLVEEPFIRHNIVLHIDDGWSEGTSVPIDDDLDSNEQLNYYNTYFNTNRHYIFRYAIIIKSVANADYAGLTFRTDAFVVANDHIYGGAFIGPFIYNQASVFMHELGHTLGLNADNLWKNDHVFGNIRPPIEPSEYPSCMRYGAIYGDPGYIDYSDMSGTIHIYNSQTANWVDFNRNDWENIDLYYFLISLIFSEGSYL